MRPARRLLSALAAGTVLASALIALPAAAQRTPVGNAATVVGTVELSNDQQRRAQQVQRRDRIAWGDLIETENRSQLQILLLDRSTFGIGARSRVRIDEYVYDPDEGRSVVVTLVRGALRFLSGRQEGENRADVNSPAARIGIRGTAIDMLVGERARSIARDEEAVGGGHNAREDEATLVVLRGPGAATQGGLTLGWAEVESAGVTVVLDSPGLAAYVPRAGVPPIGPFRISDNGLTKVQEELAPEVARAAEGGGGLLGTLIPIAVGAVALGILLSDDDENARPNADTGGPVGTTTTNNPNQPTGTVPTTPPPPPPTNNNPGSPIG